MRILIVEGMEQTGVTRVRDAGGTPYHEGYAKVLQAIDPALECVPAFPSEDGTQALPDGFAFSDFAGAAWTGSYLDAFSQVPSVLNQLNFAEKLFAAGVPIFGSCWGLQIITTALGGRVHRIPKGREIGVSRSITLTEAGKDHPMFKGKQNRFEAFTVHLDEVIEPAQGTTLLASNDHSNVQAMAGEQSGNWFWATQYHPEFGADDMVFLYGRLARLLVEEGLYETEEEARGAGTALTKGPEAYDRIELRNWLAAIST